MLRILVVLVFLTLAACGFKPVYAPSTFDASTPSVSLSQVSVTPLPERLGQRIRNTLLDRGFSDDGGAYALRIDNLNSAEFDMGVSPDNTATRRMVTVSGALVLIRDGQEILRRPIVARATYNVLVSQYATIVAGDSAQRQIVDDLAHQIETQTMLILGQQTQSIDKTP